MTDPDEINTSTRFGTLAGLQLIPRCLLTILGSKYHVNVNIRENTKFKSNINFIKVIAEFKEIPRARFWNPSPNL